MNDADKIIEVEKYFEKMKELLPNRSISIMIHDIDFSRLPKDWKITTLESTDTFGKPKKIRTANKDLLYGITLFEK